MYSITCFTEGCNPTRSAQAEDLETAIAQAVEDVDFLYGRAYGAVNSEQINGMEGQYGDLKANLAQITEIGEDPVKLGPLPDGYFVQIEVVDDPEPVEEEPVQADEPLAE